MTETQNIPIRFDISNRFRESKQTVHLRPLGSILRLTVLERDQHTCQCCGFRSRKYHEILALDGNMRDIDNMVTVCIFCYQCFQLNQVSQMRSGVLIWLPEFPQATLQHIARDIYVARISQGSEAEKAGHALAHLVSKRVEARHYLGTEDPLKLAEMIRDNSGEKDSGDMDERLKDIRLLSLDRRLIKEAGLEFNQFPQILAYWRSKSGPYANSKNRRYPWLDDYINCFF